MKFSCLFFFTVPALCAALCSCATGGGYTETFTVDSDAKPVVIGEAELQMETFMGFGKLKKITVPVSYYAKDDAVCLHYKYNLINFYQFWSRKGRMLFQSSLDNYNEDFEARRLFKNERRSNEKYGEALGYLVWQQSSFLVRAYGNMKVRFGYVFKDKSPYFSVLQLDAEYIDESIRDNNRVSDVVLMYFTRTQAADLAALFDQDLLEGFASGAITASAENFYFETDDY